MTFVTITLLAIPLGLGALVIWLVVQEIRNYLVQKHNRDVLSGAKIAPQESSLVCTTSYPRVIPVHTPPGVKAPPGTVAVKEDDPLMVKRWKVANKRRMNAVARMESANVGEDEALKDRRRADLRIAEEGCQKTEDAARAAGYNLEDF